MPYYLEYVVYLYLGTTTQEVHSMPIRVYIAILVTHLMLNVFGQDAYAKSNVRGEIRKIANRIAKGKQLDTKHVYFSARTTKQYLRFEKLYQSATNEELVELTNHPNAYVRVYSFWGLAKRKYDKLESIILKHKNDKALINTQEGCIGSAQHSVGVMLTIVTPNYWDLECRKLSERKIEDLYFEIYGNRIDLNLTPVSYEDVIQEIENEMEEMIIETQMAKGTEINRFKGIGAIIDSTQNLLLIQSDHSQFELFDFSSFEKLDSFKISTKKEIRSDLVRIEGSKIYFGTWKNFRKEQVNILVL